MVARISYEVPSPPRLVCPNYPLSSVNSETCPPDWWFFWYECCGFQRQDCCLQYGDWLQYTLFGIFFAITLSLIYSAYRCYCYLKQKTKWKSPEEDSKAHVNYRVVTQDRRTSRSSARQEL